MEELKKKTTVLLRSVLISSSSGILLSRLNKEYSKLAYSNIPLKEMGFDSLEAFIKSIPDVASLTRGADGQLLVKGIPSEADQHVAKLIAKQRKPKKRSKPAAKLRRPTSLNRPANRPFVHVQRPLALNRSSVGARPLVAVRPFVPIPSPMATFNTFPAGALKLAGAGARTSSVNRFIPPRMMRQGVSHTFANSINRTVTQKVIPGQPHVQVNVASNTTSSRRVEVVRHPVINRTVVEHGVARQVEEQAQEIASANNKITMISHQEEMMERKKKNEKPNSQDMEIFSRIKKLLDAKPKGIWLKRIGAEYKKVFHEELSNDIPEKLKELPTIAKCEEVHGGNTIIYPSQMEEKPPNKAEAAGKQINGGSPKSFELYTLRPQELPAMGSVKEITVSYVDNPTNFFVQYSDNWKQIEALGSKLNEFFQSSNSEVLPMVNEGMFCCAQFTEDDSWYRARIIGSVAKTEMAQVLYADYGNREALHFSRLRMLKKDHAELPVMAVLCALEGATSLDGDKWSASAIARFKELCDVEMLKLRAVRAEGDHLYVELKDPTGNDLGAVLQKEGYAKGYSDSSSSMLLTNSSSKESFSSVTMATSLSSSSSLGQASPLHSPNSASDEKEVKEPEMKTSSAPRPFLRHRFLSKEEEVQKIPGRVQIPDEDFMDVFVCNVHSTDNICVNLTGENYSEKLTALEQSMLCHYEEPSSEEAIKITPGGIFAVYSKEIHSEGLWYRVKALKIKGDKVHIEYVDYGEKGIVPDSSLRSIPQRFLELPFQACTLSLDGLPKTKNEEVILKLKHFTLNKDLVAEVIKKNGDTVSVELYDTSSDVQGIDISINKLLRSFVIPDEELVPILPKPGEQIEAFVTYATLEGHIFIQIPGSGTTRLDELMQDITDHYSQPTKAAEFVSSPYKGKMCCAKCSVDEAWYRALITQVLPDRQVKVQYVDYGNTEKLPISNLREPAKAIEHVNSLPFQALECRLEGTDKKALTENQAYAVMEKEVLLEVLQTSDLPIVRLFIPSEDDEQTLVNFAELIGIETETQLQNENDQPSQGNGDAVSESLDEAGSVDGDSVASENSSETSKSQDESDHMTGIPSPLDLAAPWVDIFLLEIDNPGVFRFLCLEMLPQREELQDKLQTYYAKTTRSPFRDIRPGMLCAALYAEDQTWYRVIIKASLSPQQICVLFVDDGDFKIVPSTSLQALPDEFKQLPFMAVQGCLYGVEPLGDDLAEWSEEAIQRFKQLALGKKLVAKPKGVSSHSPSTKDEAKVSLELYDTSQGNEDVLVADVLVGEGLARKIKES